MVVVYIRAVRDIPQACETNSPTYRLPKDSNAEDAVNHKQKAFVMKAILSPARVDINITVL